MGWHISHTSETKKNNTQLKTEQQQQQNRAAEELNRRIRMDSCEAFCVYQYSVV